MSDTALHAESKLVLPGTSCYSSLNNLWTKALALIVWSAGVVSECACSVTYIHKLDTGEGDTTTIRPETHSKSAGWLSVASVCTADKKKKLVEQGANCADSHQKHLCTPTPTNNTQCSVPEGYYSRTCCKSPQVSAQTAP